MRHAAEPADSDYTAPLDVSTTTGGLPSEGLKLQAGRYGNSVTLKVTNRYTAAASITLALPEGEESGVALYYVDKTEPFGTYPPVPPCDAQPGISGPANSK